ncbi:MAG: xanthine dehydrogenase family protein molybdopterin-binding subunit [Cyclobacteriaceae bacterium]|nr:xanthine dehydrogenase family protein molybdopterin-binding subunit [Cyclobacteriaceae bacterium]UYN86432.1 MAG: xanthine dehydrogenase family protein molybdopterin-binding subunit [Cyclobacteriaceae bacterium]
MEIVKTHFNRRSFIKVSAAAGGGIMIGFNWLMSCKPGDEKPGQLALPDEWFDMNAYLKVGNNGVVTIFSQNPEIGQNVKTAMPMIVAEELDVDWGNVMVEQAPLDTKKFKRQLAGGSQSIRQEWKALRTAGATARRMLVEAAAQQWNVPVSELQTENGIIKNASGKSIGYGEVASLAATLPVPEEVQLKAIKDFKLIGKPTKNVDGKKVIKGEPVFGLDIKREGMLIAMVAHAPAFGMRPKSVDDREARALPGIKDVFIINSLPEGIERQWSDVNAFPELVVMVGNSTWEVMKAKKALKIEWEATSKLENTDEYEKALSELLEKKADTPARKDGNPDEAFRKAAKVVERTYSAPFLAHNTMEPMNFFAHVTADKAELVGPIQTPEQLRTTVARVLSLPEENVTVDMTRQGGGFGRRLYGHFGVEAAVISKRVNAPVKLVYTREDDISQGTYRPAYKVKYSAALDKNNNLVGLKIRGAGIHESPVFANRFPAGTVDHYLVENHSLDSNITTGAWRAPRSNFIAVAEQSFLDEVAEAAGKDPIDFRLELLERAQTKPVGERNDYDAARYADVLKLVRQKSGWTGTKKDGVSRGVSAYFCHNSYVAQVVDLTMQGTKPVIQKVWCAADCGIVVNPEGAKNQMEGCVVDGIGHAMYSAMTFKEGVADQSNFHNYKLIRNGEAPREIECFFVDNGIDPTGLGEPGLPPVGAALANALYAATGKRLTTQPFAQADLTIERM